MTYKVNTDDYRERAQKQFAEQTGIGQEPRLFVIGLVRPPILMARLASLNGKIRRAANQRQYTVDCALRAFSHFNPKHGYCATTKCLRCDCKITDADNISIVMVALPPWTQKTDTIKTAMASGMFCAACDVYDDEAKATWRSALERDGVQTVSADAGQA